MKKFLKKLGDCIYGIIIAFLLTFAVQHTFAAAVHIDSANVSVDTTNIEALSDGASVKDALDGLYVKAAARESATCPSYYTCVKLKNTPDVGDYIQMTPTLRSFTTDKAKTGHSSTETIYPYKMNMWRVIRKNSDGTIEIVSVNSSPESINLGGKLAYMNLVGYLNELASKYENSNYTIGSRHMGYSNQTEYITDDAKLIQTTTAPWTCSTGQSCHPENSESIGGGDLGYTTDVQLVQSVFTNLSCENGNYWLASRYYYYSSSSSWAFRHRTVEGSSVDYDYTYIYRGNFTTYSDSFHLRPILILKSGISFTPATGTESSPFILE